MTMFELLTEQKEAVNFLVLLILRLAQPGSLELGARIYTASGHVLPCKMEVEHHVAARPSN